MDEHRKSSYLIGIIINFKSIILFFQCNDYLSFITPRVNGIAILQWYGDQTEK